MDMSFASLISWVVFLMQISSPRESEARMTLAGVPGHVQGMAASTVEDWTHGCPRGCICKWISGKRTAECQNNAWDRVPTFELPDRIQVLQLANNPISILPKQLFQGLGIINVQKMFLQNCNITEIHPDAFQGLEILIELDLRHNGIRQLHPGTFLGNKRIRKLWLSHNPLHTLSSFAFPSIPHLRILDLSHTRLSKLGRSTFMELEYLEVLHLRDNHFRRLDKRVFLPMQQLKSLTLERNPWQCDCRLLDFWQWLMKENLFSLPTACESPQKLQDTTWDKLSVGLLACPPEVMVPEPMVTVSTGSRVQLGCLVTENPGAATMTWIRSGIEIANNSRHAEDGAQQKYVITTGLWDHKWFHRGQNSMENTIVSVIDGGEPQAHTRGRHDSRKRWFNLTIDNVHPSGSGSYTCVAQNSGGKAVGNVTVVYSETVATYLENSKISALLVVGTASGVLVFLCLGTFLVCFGVHRKHDHTRRRREQHLCLTASGPKSGSSLLAEMEDRPTEKEMNGSTSFCVERTKSFRLQKQRAIESFPDNEGLDDDLGLEFRPHKKLSPKDEQLTCRPDAQHGMKSANQIQPSPSPHSPGVTSKDLSSIDHERLCLSVIPSVHLDSAPSRHARDKLRENSGPSSSLIVKANSCASYSANSMLGSDADSGRGSMTAPTASNVAKASASNQVGPKSKCGRDTLLSSASDSSSRGLNLTSQSVSSPTGHTASPMDSTNSSCSTQSAFGHHQNILGSSSSTIIAAKEQDQGSTSTSSGNTIRHASIPLNGCSMSLMDSMWRGGVGSSTHLFDESFGSSTNGSGTATPNANGVVGFWSSANSPCNMRTLAKQSRRFQPNDLARHRHPAGNVIHADFTLPRGENLSSARRLALNGPDFRATTLLSDRRLVPISGRDREIREISPTNHLGTPLHQHERKRNGNAYALSPSSSASVSMANAWQAMSKDESVYSDDGLFMMSGLNQKNNRVTPGNGSTTNGGLETELLVQEIETRRELLEALVKDKQDTVV
ncbi:hypothetical protein TCAL_01957 [Tigriopus californicus]|uniref:Ig-like domain-containing protein n=1 Tax=Tigriopus californicus TaxID=6832 RepID=A0A553P6A5_TIGCA|nr:uncharacterized protein LOC131878267 [Tigriopus californicus]TRY73214.1 hypothetical protein TCAL_01957 [Tigriopus californicus]|eukprot:TCALIF_01957-PA protein Name:"Similar to Lrrc38 Leucine-rich repeat-containing protein 38 (Mus musculus)" AED:0.28 eAED:0.28 QI:0/-1/0/1/-1/1/1/0/1008